jgi:hypothetical protein
MSTEAALADIKGMANFIVESPSSYGNESTDVASWRVSIKA